MASLKKQSDGCGHYRVVDYNNVVLYPTSGTASNTQVDTWLSTGGYTQSTTSLIMMNFHSLSGANTIGITVKRRTSGESSTEQTMYTGTLSVSNSWSASPTIPFSTCDEVKILISQTSSSATMQGKNTSYSGTCGNSYGGSTSYETTWIPLNQLCWGYEFSA